MKYSPIQSVVLRTGATSSVTSTSIPVAEQFPGVITLTSTVIQVPEGFEYQITATRTGNFDGAVAVTWTVADVAATPSTGDFTWGAGQSGTRSVTVTAGNPTSEDAGSITLTNPRRTEDHGRARPGHPPLGGALHRCRTLHR